MAPSPHPPLVVLLILGFCLGSVVSQDNLIVLDNFIPTNLSQMPATIPTTALYHYPFFGSSEDFAFPLMIEEMQSRGLEAFPVYTDTTDIPGGPEEVIEIAHATVNGAGLGLLSLASRDCGTALVKFLSAASFPIAYEIDADFTDFGFPIQTIFFPAFPSYTTCTDFRDLCTGILPEDILNGILGPEGCDALFNSTALGGLVVFPPQPQFPENSTTIVLGGTFVTFVPSFTFEVDQFEYTPYCQSPLEFNKKVFVEGSTARPCQDNCLGYTLYTRGQWDSVKILMGTLSWFCLITCTYISCILLLSPKYRRYPGLVTSSLTISFVVVSLPFVIGAAAGMEEVLCTDKFTAADFDHNLCAFTGAILVFSSLVAALMWSSLAVNTFVTLHLRWKPDRTKWGIATLGVGIGYPAIVMIVGTANEEWTYTPPIPWCWWVTSGLEWGLFYSCLIVCTMLNIFCIVFVLFELRNIQDSRHGKKAKYFKFLRVTCFLVMFLEVITVLIATQSIGQAREDSFTRVTTEYTVCLLTNAENPCPRPEDGTGTLSASTWFWLAATVSGVGLPAVLVFGTTGPVFFFWCRLSQGEAFDGSDSRVSMQDASASGKGFDPADEDSYDPDQD